MKEKNIGRPSTYASIISVLVNRKYVKRVKKSLEPTKLGFDVTGILQEYFTDIVDVDFTGEMDLTGSWQDEVSQRATMEIEKAETGTYHIMIHWSSSAKEASTWEISGTYDEESGMLSYQDGEYCVHTWDDQDKETISGEEITQGALLKEGDKLRWQDSKNSTDAVFVKVSK